MKKITTACPIYQTVNDMLDMQQSNKVDIRRIGISANEITPYQSHNW